MPPKLGPLRGLVHSPRDRRKSLPNDSGGGGGGGKFIKRHNAEALAEQVILAVNSKQ